MAHRLVPLALVPLARCAGAALLAACAAGCGATPNPERAELARARGEASDRRELVVGRVGGGPIPVEDFLARLWVRSGDTARSVLEQLVLAELARREAARLGLAVEAAAVQQLVDEGEAALLERLAESGSPVRTLDEHVRRGLGMDPGFYRRMLRDDAVVQLVAERCVRAHTLGSERVRTLVLDVEGAAAAEAGRALAAGEDLEAVAARFGGAEELTVLRAEGNDLARLAFATETGQVGGPLLREGHSLWLFPRERLMGREGGWAELGPAVEASLEATPVGDREFVQWRHRMVQRYAVDLSPFLDLVGDPGP